MRSRSLALARAPTAPPRTLPMSIGLEHRIQDPLKKLTILGRDRRIVAEQSTHFIAEFVHGCGLRLVLTKPIGISGPHHFAGAAAQKWCDPFQRADGRPLRPAQPSQHHGGIQLSLARELGRRGETSAADRGAKIVNEVVRLSVVHGMLLYRTANGPHSHQLTPDGPRSADGGPTRRGGRRRGPAADRRARLRR